MATKSTFSVTMSNDVPAMAVDVLNPDLTVRSALAARPGEALRIDDADDGSLFRFAVPGGPSVVLGASEVNGGQILPEQLGFVMSGRARTMPSASIEMFGEPPRAYEAFGEEGGGAPRAPVPILLRVGGTRDVLSFDGTPVTVYPQAGSDYAIPVRIDLDEGVSVTMRVPLSTTRLKAWVYVDESGGVPMLALRIKTASPTSDALANYLLRNDLDSAAQLGRLVSDAVLECPPSNLDVFEACAGAYVMLRRAQAGRLLSFAGWLHGIHPTPDTAVILASCLVDTASEASDEVSSRITALLKSAIDGGYPIYTVGLRMLADTVHLLGDEGERLNAQFLERRGTTYWRSPFDTAWIAEGQGDSRWTRASLDIACDTLPDGWTSYPST